MLRELPNGTKIDGALWLRVRARLLDAADRTVPDLTNGLLADLTDAACVGFCEHARDSGFASEYAKWYAARVIEEMKEDRCAPLVALLEELADDHIRTELRAHGISAGDYFAAKAEEALDAHREREGGVGG